jgi:hypothetical protein
VDDRRLQARDESCCKVKALGSKPSLVMAGQKAPTGPRERGPMTGLRAVFMHLVPAIHVFFPMHKARDAGASSSTLR